MNISSQPTVCRSNEVLHISYQGEKKFFSNTDTFRVRDLLAKLKSSCQHQQPIVSAEEAERLFYDGLDCELLSPDVRGWKKGKIKVKLEFVPDSSEEPNDFEANGKNSTLDGIRQIIHKETH